MKQKKICFFNSCSAWGGGEKWHFEAAEFLSQHQFEVSVAAAPGSPLYRKAKQAGITTRSVKVGNLSALNLFKILGLANWMRREDFDVVILNLPSDLKCAGLAAKIAGVRRVIYRRGSAIPVKNTVLNRWLFGNLLDDVLANSEETKKTLLVNNPNLFPAEKIHVIYNGIDCNAGCQEAMTPSVKFVDGSPFVIGTAGRMSRQKNQKFLVDLAVSLLQVGRDFKVRIAGDGPLRNELENYARQCGVLNYFEFLGFVKDVDRFMQGIDLFVLPSHWEGFGYVLVEAMAARKAVVAFDISSNPEIISNGETGFLAPFDDLNAFTEKTCLLMDEPELRMQMGRNGYARVRCKFDKKNNLKMLAGILLEGM